MATVTIAPLRTIIAVKVCNQRDRPRNETKVSMAGNYSTNIFKIFDSNFICSGFSSFKTWRAYLIALWGDFNLILFNESNSADLDIALPCASTPLIRKKE